MEDHERQAIPALVVVQVLFGLLPAASKLAFEVLGPFPVIALRTLGAAYLLRLVHDRLVKRPVVWKQHWRRILPLALFGIILNQGLFILGVQRTTSLNASLVITTIPVFTYAIAVLSGRERLGPRRAMGIALAFAGVLYLIGLSGYELGARHAIGDLLVALNSIAFAVFLVISRPMSQEVDGISLTAWLFFIGAIVFVPLGLFTGLPEQVQQMTPAAWGAMAFIILGPSVTTYVLNAVALARVPSSTVAVFIYLQPIFAALAAYFVLKEPISGRIVPAALLIFLGVYLVTRRRLPFLRGRPVGA